MKLYKSSPLQVLDNSDFKVHWGKDGLVIPVKGFIFSSEKDTDLEGDFFTPETDRGPLDKVISYFDHQMSNYYIPREVNDMGIRGFGGKRIGYAEKMLTDEEKEVWNIIVDRRHHYINLIEELAMEKMVGASSLALHRVDDPTTKGRIVTWDTAAMDLTPTPAEPRAEAIVKHFIVENFDQLEQKGIFYMPSLEENIKNAFKNAEEDIKEEVEETEDVEEVEETEDVDHPTDEDIESVDDTEGLKAILLGLNERLDRMEDNIQKSIDMNKDTQSALEVYAEETAKYVTKNIREIARQTTEEFDAESEVLRRKSASKHKSNGKLNMSAPGVK
jgi:hypothetical protein